MPVLSLAEGIADELYQERRFMTAAGGDLESPLPGKTNLHFTENISNGGPGSLSNQTG